MIITIDTQKLDNANEFGEVLREYAFKDSYGCYSCFELIDEFKLVTSGPLFDFYAEKLVLNCDPSWSNIEEDLKNMPVYTNGQVDIGWFWDGDGELIIREGKKTARNDDCKKDYNWVWLTESEDE